MTKTIPISSVKWGFPFLAPGQEKPSEFLYKIAYSHEIGPGVLFHDCLVDVAHAHRKHPDGNRYVCYGTWVGPGLVWLMYPLEDEKDVLKLLSNEAALEEAAGPDVKDAVKPWTDFQATLIDEHKDLIKYCPQASCLPSNIEAAPFDYIYYIVVRLNHRTDTDTFTDHLQKLIAANKTVPGGYEWITYLSRGENPPEAHIFIPMRTFSQMDNWSSPLDILLAGYPDEGASIITTVLSAAADIQTHLMTFVPSCDNSGFEFSEVSNLYHKGE